MKVKRIGRIVAILIAIVAIFPCSFFVGTAHAEEKFDTKDFSVYVKVHEDNTLDVKERITVNFNQQSQGIYRVIPFKGVFKMKRNNELIEEKVRAEIYDIEVKGGAKAVTTEGPTKHIRIGTKGKYLSGEKTYEIDYKVRFYKDTRDDFDFLYLNVLPDDWETTIEKGTLRVEFPKDFDTNELSTYLGDEEQRHDFTSKEDGKVIWEARATNLYKTGVTIHAYLPEGYFADAASVGDNAILPVLLSGIIALISLALWFFFGRDEKDIEVVEFRAPNGMDPIELSYHLTGNTGADTVAPEIMYLGNNGFLTLEMDEENDTFYLEKTDKDYENEISYVGMLMNRLFSAGSKVDLRDRSESYWLGLNTVGDVAKSVLEIAAGEKRETRASKVSQWFMKAGLLIIIIATTFAVGITPGTEDAMFAFPVIGGVAAFLGSGFWDDAFQKRDISTSRKIKVFYVLGGVALAGNIVALAWGSNIYWDSIVPGLIIGIAMLIIAFFHVIGGKATDKAHKMRGRILGFKNFLEEVEVDKMKELVDEDPSYFFDIMPYTFLFGFKDKWMSKFAEVVNDAPPWVKHRNSAGEFVSDYDTIATYALYSSMNNHISYNIQEAVQAEIGASISDAGSSSSGGFGGGGFGGGGGGSW